MENFFSISEAAKMVNMTSETLRHYDRIGLVKVSRRDEASVKALKFKSTFEITTLPEHHGYELHQPLYSLFLKM